MSGWIMTSLAKVGDFPGQTRHVAGLAVEELHPGVEMTHVGVSQIDVGLDFRIDRPDDVLRQQIVNDHSTVLRERAYDLLGRGISLNRLEATVVNR